MTVAEFLSRVTSYELTEWQAYSEIQSDKRKKDELETRARANYGKRIV